MFKKAQDILQEIYEAIDEEDSDIGCKAYDAYDAAELINNILDEALVGDE